MRTESQAREVETNARSVPRVGDLITLVAIDAPALVVSQFECTSTRFMILFNNGDYCFYTWSCGYAWKLRVR